MEKPPIKNPEELELEKQREEALDKLSQATEAAKALLAKKGAAETEPEKNETEGTDTVVNVSEEENNTYTYKPEDDLDTDKEATPGFPVHNPGLPDLGSRETPEKSMWWENLKSKTEAVSISAKTNFNKFTTFCGKKFDGIKDTTEKGIGAFKNLFKTKDKPPVPEMNTKFVAEKINDQIKNFEAMSGTKMTPEQKQKLGQEIFLKSKEEHNQELAKNAGGFEKFLQKGQEYWKNLDNTRLGKISKVAVGSALIGGTALGASMLLGTVPSGDISRRLFNRVLVSTGLNAMVTSNLTRKGLDALGMDQTGDKFKKYAKMIGVGGGLTASFLLGGAVVGAIGVGGFLAKEGLNRYFNSKIQKLNFDIQNFKIESKNFDDGFDINELAEKMNTFEKERSKMEKTLKRLSWGKNVLNHGLTIGASVATISAFNTSTENTKLNETVDNTENEKIVEDNNTDNQKPLDVPRGKGFAEAIGKAHETIRDNENFEVVEKGQGVTQVLKEINEKGNAPEWFHKMLGEEPTPKDFARFAEAIGVYNPDDIKDSLVITENDKIGFDNSGNLIMERDSVEYNLAKADDMGGFTEGDWQEKMQGEKFMDTDQKHLQEEMTASKTPTHVLPDDNSPEYIEERKPNFEDTNTNTTNDAENRDPKGLFKEADMDSKLEDENNDVNETSGGYTTEGAYDTDKDNSIENKIEISNTDQEKIDNLYETNIKNMFPNEEKNHLWHGLQKVPAEKIMNLNNTGEIYKPIIEHFRELKEITGLEPIGESINHKAETVPEYMERAYGEAFKLGKLDEIKIENTIDDLKTGPTMIDLTETHEKNIENIFYKKDSLMNYTNSEGETMNPWIEIKDDSAKEWLEAKANKVPTPLQPFARYMDKLHEVTGLEPLDGKDRSTPETTENYIKRALLWAGHNGKLDEVVIKTESETLYDDKPYDPSQFK